MLTIKELENIRVSNEFTVEGFTDILSVSRQTYYNWIKQDSIPEAKALLIEKKLLENEITSLQAASETIMSYNNTSMKSEVRQVPHTDYMEVSYLSIEAQAGYMDSLENNQIPNLDTMLVPVEFEKGNYLVVEVSGESMNDGTLRSVCDGDRLLCKDLQKHHWRNKLHYKQYLFVIVGRDGIVCKQVTGHDVEKGIITCHSWNPQYKDYVIHLDEVYQLLYVKKIVERRIKF